MSCNYQKKVYVYTSLIATVHFTSVGWLHYDNTKKSQTDS